MGPMRFASLVKLICMAIQGIFALFSKICHFVCYLFRKQARQVIQYQTVRYHIVPLSPLSRQRLSLVKRKTLVLDLDETLIHSHHDGIVRPMVKPGTPPDFILRVTIDRHPVRFFVHKRPHVDYFLSIVSQWYDLVVYTASMEIYGTAVADKLDMGRGLLTRRYFRQHCNLDLGGYSKDLSSICPDLSSIFILDNSPGAYRQFPDNAIPIKSWFSDPSDTALLNLLPFLDSLRYTSDVRSILSRNLHLHRYPPMMMDGSSNSSSSSNNSSSTNPLASVAAQLQLPSSSTQQSNYGGFRSTSSIPNVLQQHQMGSASQYLQSMTP